MSAGTILTILANVPWGQVVDNAPKVADGAAKLWSTVSGFRRKTAPVDVAEASPGEPVPTETELLAARALALEEAVRELSDQMQASSELIKALAEQNAQLVQGIEANRRRLHRLGVAVAVLSAVIVAIVGYLALRP